ncbi:DUF7453 family protein [Poriferisphaera sp. WC338]|uniref:DUF7453 family protein n=1 Tax=Poriferisphaera sp. WC338 TaxID=3425129 RepID=UPI003D8165E0
MSANSSFASNFETVVLTGQAAGQGSKTFQAFDRVDLNNHGDLVFQAIVDDDDSDQTKTYANYYVSRHGGGGRIALESVVSDASWVVGHSRTGYKDAGPLWNTQINDNGTIGYVKRTATWNGGLMDRTTTAPFEVVMFSGGVRSVLARTGTVTPFGVVDSNPADVYAIDHGTPLDYFELGEDDVTYFSAELKPSMSGWPTTSLGFLSASSSGIGRVFVEGDEVSGGDFAFQANPYETYKFAANSHGDAVFAHRYPYEDVPGLSFNGNVTFFDASAGTYQKVIEAGAQAVGLSDGSYYQIGPKHSQGLMLNDNGTAIIQVYVHINEINAQRPSLYLYKDGALSFIATSNYGHAGSYDAAFFTMSGPLALNNRDEFLFYGMPVPAAALNLYLGDVDGFESVYEVGSLAAGFDVEGYKYTGGPNDRLWRDQEYVQLNDNGTLTFLVSIANDAGSNVDALYARGLDGALDLIAYTGMDFDVETDTGIVTKTIASFDQDVFDLNNQNVLAFALTFTDGSSGIFTTVVPEPAAMALLLFGMAPLVMCRRGA